MNNNKKSYDNRLIELGSKLKKSITSFLKKHGDLIIMNVIIFILTVFIESLYIHKLKLLVWFFNTIIFIAGPTILFTLKRGIKSKDIILSIPMLYILFLIFLSYCTLRELYGISSLGLDKIPNYIDALMVVFVFTFFEYITVLIVNKVKIKKNRIKKA